MKHMYYKLNDKHEPVPCTIEELEEQYKGDATRRVDETFLGDNVRVSTVFLCIDHAWGDDGPPILFETMIFGGEYDGYQQRCCTWEEAVAGHKTAVEFVRQSLNI